MRFFPFCVLILTLISCSSDPKITEFSGNIMGTYYIVKTVGEVDKDELAPLIQKRLDELNKVFSTYDVNSELSKINASSEKGHKVSAELKEVLQLSLEISSASNGYFDVTVGPLVNAWGFGPSGLRRRPQKEQIAELMKNVGHQKISLADNTLLKVPGVYIDLSAIAKGYAVDKIIEFIQQKKIKSALVEIGGEVRTLGKKNKEDPWIIGIEKPSNSDISGIQRIIPLENMAMATSGSYRNFRKYGDEIFSHTIDPKTGFPVDHKLISVSVIAKTCVVADGFATAFLALGPEKGLELANEKDIMAYFMLKEGDKIITKSSVSFDEYLKTHQVNRAQ